MNYQMVNMLEAIKRGNYTSYVDYLDKDSIEKIIQWSHLFILENTVELDNAINLMYLLYIKEDIDFHPYEEYSEVALYLSEKFNFDKKIFLNLYQQFRQMIWGV